MSSVALTVRLFADAIVVNNNHNDERIVVANTPQMFLQVLDKIESVYASMSYTVHAILVSEKGEQPADVEELRMLATLLSLDIDRYHDDGGSIVH